MVRVFYCTFLPIRLDFTIRYDKRGFHVTVGFDYHIEKYCQLYSDKKLHKKKPPFREALSLASF